MNDVEPQDVKLMYYDYIINIYLSKQEFELATAYAHQLTSFDISAPYGNIFIGKIAYLQNDLTKSKSYYLAAAAQANNTTNIGFIYAIAEGLMILEDFDSAINLLNSFVDIRKLDKLHRLLITTLYHSGKNALAYEHAMPFFRDNKSDPFLADVISSIFEREEKYVESIDAITEYLAFHPDDRFTQIKLAINYYKNDEYNKSTKVLDTIADFSGLSIEYRFSLVDAYAKTGNVTKALQLAYKLRNENLSSRQAHTLYMQAVLNIQRPDSEIYPKLVEIDAAVQLINKLSPGRIETFLIVDVPLRENEVGLSDPLGVELLGKKMGDTIRIGGESYEVSIIMSKYTYAFQESMRLISTRFGNEGPLKVGRMDPSATPTENIKRIFETLGSFQAHQNVNGLQSFYGELTGYSMGTCAMLTGFNIINYWQKETKTVDEGVFINGGGQEAQEGLVLVKQNKGIVMDITGILTVAALDLFPNVQKLNLDIFVSASTIAEITAEITRLAGIRDNRRLPIGEHIGNAYQYLNSEEAFNNQIDLFNQMLENVTKIAKVVEPSLADDFNKKKELNRILGKSFNETLLIAKEKQLFIWSDDFMFRILARNKMQIRGVSTLSVIDSVQQEGYIPFESTEAYFFQLLKMNYRFIPINPNLMMKALRDAKYHIDFPFNHACDMLMAGLLSDQMAVVLVVTFFYRLYVEEPIASGNKDIGRFVFTSLFQKRDIQKIKQMLVPAMYVKFKLLPVQMNELLEMVNAFN